jgi:hypothetical protein
VYPRCVAGTTCSERTSVTEASYTYTHVERAKVLQQLPYSSNHFGFSFLPITHGDPIDRRPVSEPPPPPSAPSAKRPVLLDPNTSTRPSAVATRECV